METPKTTTQAAKKDPTQAAYDLLMAKFELDVWEAERVDLIVGVQHGGQATTSIRGRIAGNNLAGSDGSLFYAPNEGVVFFLSTRKGLMVIPVSNCRQVVLLGKN